MEVPDGWSDRRTSAVAAARRAPPRRRSRPSPDMTAFLDGYDAPGLTAVVVGADARRRARRVRASTTTARAADARPYDGGAAGRASYEVWRDCGGHRHRHRHRRRCARPATPGPCCCWPRSASTPTSRRSTPPSSRWSSARYDVRLTHRRERRRQEPCLRALTTRVVGHRVSCRRRRARGTPRCGSSPGRARSAASPTVRWPSPYGAAPAVAGADGGERVGHRQHERRARLEHAVDLAQRAAEVRRRRRACGWRARRRSCRSARSRGRRARRGGTRRRPRPMAAAAAQVGDALGVGIEGDRLGAGLGEGDRVAGDAELDDAAAARRRRRAGAARRRPAPPRRRSRCPVIAVPVWRPPPSVGSALAIGTTGTPGEAG